MFGWWMMGGQMVATALCNHHKPIEDGDNELINPIQRQFFHQTHAVSRTGQNMGTVAAELAFGRMGISGII
ncbi:hypothetical protein AND_010015 [Anopheles darlingi]|uniref:Uncharacterized protein n=1 Tax=Anopheles darlingi TaxID=43151 RepID=W5J3K0_ANODA|nr:hypothetical protein AND_010015 [Anopheles darlingi]